MEQLRTQPSLKDLFVHIVHFIQSKSLSLLQTRPTSDSLVFYLMIEALESIVHNDFYDIELRLSDLLSILVSLALHSTFNQYSSYESIFELKMKAAKLLGHLLIKSHSRIDLQQECCNLLLKSMVTEDCPSKYQFLGSLMSL